jgi:hypothetical protein
MIISRLSGGGDGRMAKAMGNLGAGAYLSSTNLI